MKSILLIIIVVIMVIIIIVIVIIIIKMKADKIMITLIITHLFAEVSLDLYFSLMPSSQESSFSTSIQSKHHLSPSPIIVSSLILAYFYPYFSPY